MEGQPVILLGAGGHARVGLDSLQEAGTEVLGILDRKLAPGTVFLGVQVLGSDEAIRHYDSAQVRLVNGIGSVGDDSLRRRLFDRFREQGFSFATVVHPRACVSRHAELDEGVQILAGAVVSAGAVLGKNAIINTRASVDHDCILGAHVHIAPGATLSGGVTVGTGSHIGTGAAVIQGIAVGKQALVGAGSVVIRNVPDGGKVCGVPAREMRG